MAFEGLLTKLGPSLVRELSPHLLQLTGNFLERFRKDTGAVQDSLKAELTSLRQNHALLAAASDRQAESTTSLQTQLTRVEEKVDRLQQSHETVGRQIAALEEQLRLQSRTPAGVLWATLVLVLLTLGVAVALLITRR